MAAEGADIVDVGGESTRPGSEEVPIGEERRRVLPVVERLVAQLPGVAISIDTRKAEVARAAIDAGATIVNDVAAGRDPRMLAAVAATGAGYVAMHMLGEPKTMQADPRYDDVVREVRGFLAGRVGVAEAAGIGRERLCVDPGIGFGKSLEHNLVLMRNLDRIVDLGLPVLVGPSRKRFIGTLTGVDDPAERADGTAGAVAWLVAAGAHVVRVHDVEMGEVMAQVVAAVGRVRRLDRVERIPRRAVADHVDVELEPRGVDQGNDAEQVIALDEHDPAPVRRRAVDRRIGIEQSGREAVAHAVGHDLDARRDEPPLDLRGPRTTLFEERELGLVAVPIPPQRTDHAGGERAAPRRAQVGLEAVVQRLVRADDRVLPARDAQGVEVALGLEQPGELLVGLHGRDDPPRETHRALVQHPGGIAVRVALDPSVVGVRRVPVDAGELEGAGVHPGRVVRRVRQERRAVGDPPVQQLRVGPSPGEVIADPTAAEDPSPVRVASAVRQHALLVGLDRPRGQQVDAEPVQPGRGSVDVGVLEPRQHGPTACVDHLGGRSARGTDDLVGADRDDPTLADRHGGHAPPLRVDRADLAPDDREVGRAGRAHGRSGTIDVSRRAATTAGGAAPGRATRAW